MPEKQQGLRGLCKCLLLFARRFDFTRRVGSKRGCSDTAEVWVPSRTWFLSCLSDAGEPDPEPSLGSAAQLPCLSGGSKALTQKPEILDLFWSVTSSASAALLPWLMSLCNCLAVWELRAAQGSTGEAGSVEGYFTGEQGRALCTQHSAVAAALVPPGDEKLDWASAGPGCADGKRGWLVCSREEFVPAVVPSGLSL